MDFVQDKGSGQVHRTEPTVQSWWDVPGEACHSSQILGDVSLYSDPEDEAIPSSFIFSTT